MIIKIKQIKDQMRNKRVSQKYLAQQLEVTERTVSRWMSGSQTIPTKYHDKLAVILDLDTTQNVFEDVPRRSADEKRISSSLPLRTLNDLYFLENWMGRSRSDLIMLLPRLLKVVGKLALEHEAEKLKELEEIEAKLPRSWGPQTDDAKANYERRKKALKSGNPFINEGIISSFLFDKDGIETFGESAFKRVHFSEDLNSILELCIGMGFIDISKFEWSLWEEENQHKLKEKLLQQATVNLNQAFDGLKSASEDDEIFWSTRLHYLLVLFEALKENLEPSRSVNQLLREIESTWPTGLKEYSNQEELTVIKENLAKKNFKKSFFKHVKRQLMHEAGERSGRQAIEEIVKNMKKDEQNEVLKGTLSPKLEKELIEIFNTPEFEEKIKDTLKQMLKKGGKNADK